MFSLECFSFLVECLLSFGVLIPPGLPTIFHKLVHFSYSVTRNETEVIETCSYRRQEDSARAKRTRNHNETQRVYRPFILYPSLLALSLALDVPLHSLRFVLVSKLKTEMKRIIINPIRP